VVRAGVYVGGPFGGLPGLRRSGRLMRWERIAALPRTGGYSRVSR